MTEETKEVASKKYPAHQYEVEPFDVSTGKTFDTTANRLSQLPVMGKNFGNALQALSVCINNKLPASMAASMFYNISGNLALTSDAKMAIAKTKGALPFFSMKHCKGSSMPFPLPMAFKTDEKSNGVTRTQAASIFCEGVMLVPADPEVHGKGDVLKKIDWSKDMESLDEMPVCYNDKTYLLYYHRHSLFDSIRAGVTKGGSTWDKYPEIMMRNRTLGNLFRRAFPLSGTTAASENVAGQDMPHARTLEAEEIDAGDYQDNDTITATVEEVVKPPVKAKQPVKTMPVEEVVEQPTEDEGEDPLFA